MESDFWIVLQWWGTLFLVGAVAWPLTKRLYGEMRGIREIRGIRGIGEKQEEGGWWDKGEIPGQARNDSNTGWFDDGYLFSKAVGMATVTWIVYVMGTLRVMPFSVWSIAVALGVVFLVGIVLQLKTIVQNSKREGQRWIPAFAGMTMKGSGMTKHDAGVTLWKACVVVLEELFFLVALLAWSWVKGHEPSIRGLEKFMDYGFMQSILHAQFFPPADMWYAGFPINYYYFGHMVTAVLTKLSGLDLAVTFNLMLATIFALTLTMSFSIGFQLSHMSLMGPMGRMRNMAAGALTAFLVTMAGNMQTIYAFTRGYTGENVKPFWELFWRIRDLGNLGGLGILGNFSGKLGEGMHTYWYANATRFIPFTIHEFPSYSFVVSDVHGHVLSIPFVLLVIGLLIQTFLLQGQASAAGATRGQALWYGFYGFLVGVLLMTNALDGPIYFALLAAVLVIIPARNATHSVAGGQLSNNPINKLSNWKKTGAILALAIVVAGLTSLPFLIHFKSFVTGVAVNCPPAFLANMKFGPILFEGIEKCQRSPLWMWWLLWGFFVYSIFPLLFCHSGLRAGIQPKEDGSRVKPGMTVEKLLLVFFTFALVLVVVPEFIYFKDIYPAHFRSNTMFKLGYEAFILFSIVAGYTIMSFFLSFPRKLASLSRSGRESMFLGLDPRLRGDDKKDSGDDKKDSGDD
ncbi:MAG: DUF2298 domain-containing protein, partial [Patescibacteria group bacterium]